MKDNVYYEALDLIDEGIIIVDAQKIINFINKPAMKLFGMDLSDRPDHPAGDIKPDDIAILACNCAGLDEEILGMKDLELIGVNPADVEKGDALIAVGQVGAPLGSALIKTKPYCHEDRVLEMEYLYDSEVPVKATINEIKNLLEITINTTSYKIKFQNFDNLLVIIDPTSKKVKFYQSRGYTIRGEAIRNVLRGRPFVAKGKYAKVPKMKGTHISLIKPDELCIECLEQVLEGVHESIRGREYSFNEVYVRFSAYPIKDGKNEISGCTLIFNDITDIKHLQSKIKASEQKKTAFSNIVGCSQQIINVKDMAHKVSLSNSTVLVLGESGTGKGLFARAIHDNSKRASKAFVAVNMAAIPSTLLESELFGYEEGAFTGAKKSGKPGKFKLADKGTIFLDEIGDMDLSLQAKLLQVLQEGRIHPLGSVKPVEVDVRVIAATNSNLEEKVKQGLFREDLFYRLNVITIEIPPLRFRKSDIKELVAHMLPLLNSKVGKKVDHIEKEVFQLFLAYEWPGNIRQLENVMESAINLAEGNTITINDLPQRFLNRIKTVQNDNGSKASMLSIKSASYQAEKKAIEMALSLTGGNRTEAAKLLKIGRTALYNKLKKYNLQ